MITKEQANAAAKRYVRTPSGRLNFIYRKQIARSKERNFPMPAYTFDELKAKYLNSRLYKKLFAAWVASNYNKQLVPSFDRPDSTKPYTFKNLRLMTWAENRQKQASVDIHNSHDTPVAAIVAEVVIAIYGSQREATIKTGAKNIYPVLHGKRKTSAGYVWRSLYGTSQKEISKLKSKLPLPCSAIEFNKKPHSRIGVFNGIKNKTKNYSI